MRKSIKCIINSLLLATFLGAATIPLASCSSDVSSQNSSNKGNNSSTKESSNNKPNDSTTSKPNDSTTSKPSESTTTSKPSESTNTNSVESTFSKIVSYIIDNKTSYFDAGYLKWSSYNIYTGKYNGYSSEVYAYNPYSDKSSSEFEILSIMEFSNYYMVAEFTFTSRYIAEGEIPCQTRVYSSKPSTLKCGDFTNVRVRSNSFNVPLNFNSTSPSLLEYTYEDGYSLNESTLNKNSTMLVDLGLSYLTSFMSNIGCNIKTFGFINY